MMMMMMIVVAVVVVVVLVMVMVMRMRMMTINDQLKKRYKAQYRTHHINTVDEMKRIMLKEVEVEKFAVNLKISKGKARDDEFSNEMRKHLKTLKRFTGDNVKISELIVKDKRVSFIRGIAGIGKTVLTKQIAVGWAEDKMYTERLCIVFECRQLNRFMKAEGANLKNHEAFDEFLKSICKLDNFDLGNGEGVVFVVDGLDELYDVNTEDSIIGQLLNIKWSKYIKSKIIITGRPHIEYKLYQHGYEMGCVQTYELQGLSFDQINEYISKFSNVQNDISAINHSIDLSKRHLPILHVPQFLNTFCCVAILTKGEAINNTAELYSWTIYLLLKQHDTYKMHLSIQNFSKTFEKYSNLLSTLSKVCFMLLNENKILFEEKIETLARDTDKGKIFFESLFMDVSDDFKDKYQFTHLSIMEFLAALHICSNAQDLMKIIEEYLDRGFIEVVSFTCSLIAGLSSEGIIKELLKTIDRTGLKTIDQKQFMENVLEKINGASLNDDTKFKRSIEIISCFLSNDFNDREFLLRNISKVSFEGSLEFMDSNYLLNICNHLDFVYDCNESSIQSALESLKIQKFNVNNWSPLQCVKYLNVVRIGLNELKTDVNEILLKLEDIRWIGRDKEVWIRRCKLEDVEEIANTTDIAFEELTIFDSKLNTNSFKNCCKLGVLSKRFRLMNQDIKGDWWEVLAQKIEERNLNEALNLNISGCTTKMTEECKKKIMHCGVELWIDREKVALPSTSVPETGASNTSRLPERPSSSIPSSTSGPFPSTDTTLTVKLTSTEANNVPTQVEDTPLTVMPTSTEASNVPTEVEDTPLTVMSTSTEVRNVPTEVEEKIPGTSAVGNIGRLSELSHGIREKLADKLEYKDCGCLRLLIPKCTDELDAIDIKKIKYNLLPSISFFEHLAQKKPQLTLDDIRKCIENRNNAIFKNIDEAILKREVAFTLKCTLQELQSNEKHWDYILNHIAIELVGKERYLLPTWKDVADDFGFTSEFIRDIETRNVDRERPTFKLLSILIAKFPDLCVDYLVNRLKDLERFDIIEKCGWSEMLQE